MTGRRCDMRKRELTIFWLDSNTSPLICTVQYDHTVEGVSTVFEKHAGKEYIIYGRDYTLHIPYNSVRYIIIGHPKRLT